MNDEINPAIEEALGEVFKIIPAVTSEGDNHTVTYSDFRLVDDTFKQKSESIKAAVSGASGFALSDDRKSITFTASGVAGAQKRLRERDGQRRIAHRRVACDIACNSSHARLYRFQV